MELERELDDLNERLEEQGGATQAQVKKWLYGGSLRGKRNEGEGGGFPFSPSPFPFFHFLLLSLQPSRNNLIGNACYTDYYGGSTITGDSVAGKVETLTRIEH